MSNLIKAKVGAKYHAGQLFERLTVALYKDEGSALEEIHLEAAFDQFKKLTAEMNALQAAFNNARQPTELAR